MERIKRVNDWIDKNHKQLVDYLRDLVKIPSINPWFFDYKFDCGEREVQELIAQTLCKMNFSVDIWETDPEQLKKYDGMPGYFEGRMMKNRPNLCGTLKGAGGGRSLLLTGHADVVKVGEGWSKKPFATEIAQGKLYGRGTVDMKGGIAAMIMAVKALQHCGIQLKGDVLVGTVADEEAGGMGTLDFVHRGYKADGAIMTEPTALELGTMCRGILWGKLVIPARAGHIEMYQGHWRADGAVDAIKLVQLYLAQIDRFNQNWSTEKTHPLLPMPCQLLVAQIHAGEYPSSFAGSAEICFNAQYLPDELDENYRGSVVKKEIEDFVAAVAQTDGWMRENPPHVEWLLDADCAETAVESNFVQSLITSARRAGGKGKVSGVGSHTDMGWYVHTGTPTVNFGPGNPKIAHQADEHIELEEYLQSVKQLAAMVMDWCGVLE